jgi:hypothetical protein
MIRNRPADPVFVGGTGRSGTTILGQLIGEHSQYAFIPMEIKFHCDPNGLAGLLRGEISREGFMAYMRDKWFPKATRWSDPDYAQSWKRLRKADLPNPEIRLDLAPERILRLVGEFESSYPNEPDSAARILLRSLLDPIARRVGKSSWVETTPSNGKYADTLARLFPDMRIVHVVRDGRDVASSRLARNRRPLSANVQAEFGRELRWWAKRLRITVDAVNKLPPDRALTVSFEDLVATDRDRSYNQLLGFLGVADEPPVREFFDTQLSPGAAHIGRWKQDPYVSPRKATAMYRRILAELGEQGVNCVPKPEQVEQPEDMTSRIRA